MPRSTPIHSDLSLDADIRALMEDIDASMVDFEQRLEAEQLRLSQPAQEEEPAAAPIPMPRVALPPAGKEPAAPPPEAPPFSPSEAKVPAQTATDGGLLAELAAEANARSGVASRRASDRRLIHEALDRIYRFLDVFCRHVNTLAPAIARTYRLDARAAYGELRWQEAMVKSRKDSLSEAALLDFVAFRVRLVAPAPVTVTVG